MDDNGEFEYEGEYPEDGAYPRDEDFDFEHICDCGYVGAGDVCTICGNPMCFRCFEVKCGVCERDYLHDQVEAKDG